MKPLVTLFGLFAAMIAPALGAERDVPTEAAVNRVIRPWIEKQQPPGVIVVVRQEGMTEFFPFGEANRERRVPVTPDSIFELASVTKVFTTTSLAIEVERGQARLEDPVDRYWPQLGEGRDIRHVTLLQLATHTSSLPRVALKHPGKTEMNQREVAQWVLQWKAAEPPGTKYLYSNVAMGVLGEALAVHAKLPMLELWERQFLHPLEMRSTYFAIPNAAAEHFVQGYGAHGKPVPRAAVPGGWPAGGRLCSSGRDMGEFLTANLGEAPERPVITRAMQFAQKPQFEVSPQMTLGLAWQRGKLHGELLIDKNGGLDGTSTYIGMLPERHLGVVVMANRGKSKATIAGRQLLAALARLKETDEPPLPDAEFDADEE
ncbi:MAG: serine hydrolase [Planctomycetales bacterium]